MRLTLSDLVTYCQDASGGDTSNDSFFKRRINQRYEQVLSRLPSHLSEVTKTFSTVADQQYYHYPPTMLKVESLVITIGSRDYPLEPMVSYAEWDRLNAIDFQGGAIPRYFFNRQRDFGIWPIPQAVYTGTVVYSIRAGGMVNDDYTTGTVDVTQNSDQVTGNSSSWSGDVFAGQWFSLADSNSESKGDWYRIESVDGETTITLETVFEASSASTSSYIIGDSPELPEETHILLAQGAMADYYAEKRQALEKAQAWNNMFWTGDWNTSKNAARQDPDYSGGLVGAIRRYRDRSDTQLIQRRRNQESARFKTFATDLS